MNFMQRNVIFLSWLTLVVNCGATLFDSSNPSGKYDGKAFERNVHMNGNGCSNVKWTFDTEAKDITLAVTSAPGASWVGIGISEQGGMKGADIAMVRLDPNSSGDRFIIDDLFSHDYVAPGADVIQNFELLYAVIDDEDRIQAVVRRDADTCDVDDLPITGAKQNLICASGWEDSDGNPTFHGKQRARALVNLVIDENLLLERKLDLDFISGNDEHLVQDVVVARKDLASATSPIPVDFQMPGITLDRTQKTQYRCLVFTMPEDMNIVAYEGVWDNGTTLHDEEQPLWLHHQNIRYCPLPEMIQPEHMNGKPFDCFRDIPPCEVHVGHAQNGFLQTPVGVHLPLRKGGTYMLTVHYDNPYGAKLEDDTSGIRVWVDPPALESQGSPGQVTYLRANFDSIVIPADPEQKEYELQFMISAEATRAALPAEGVQVFATHAHMHVSGNRATAKLIRNGTHISNVYDSKGYDFALQTPYWNLWKFLPGDTIIMSCFYTPSKEHDIVGGWNTEDEMCDLVVGLAPEVPKFNFGVGWMVRPGEPFKNSYMGTSNEGTTAKDLTYDAAIYAPNEEGRNYVPLKDHRLNHCDSLVRDRIDFHRVSWASPEIPAQFFTLGGFFLFFLAYYALGQQKGTDVVPIIQDERKRRNTVIYIVQMVFSLFALPVISWQLAQIVQPSSRFDAVNPDTYQVARGMITAQSILFLLELFYRINVRWEIIIHHILASGLVIFLNWVGIETLAVQAIFKLGCVLTLMAVTEQPAYLALILRNLGYAKRGWWSKLCLFAGWSYIATKLLLAALCFAILAQFQSEEEGSWSLAHNSFAEWNSGSDMKISVGGLIAIVVVMVAALLCAQLYVGILFLKLARTRVAASSSTSAADEMNTV